MFKREDDYAIRVIRALADGKKRTVEEISELETIPKQFLYKIVQKLSLAEIVESTRGVDGGCYLLADIKTLTLYDILQAVGANFHMNVCLREGAECVNNVQEHPCQVHKEMLRIQNLLIEELKGKTMADLCHECQ